MTGRQWQQADWSTAINWDTAAGQQFFWDQQAKSESFVRKHAAFSVFASENI